MEGDLGSGDGGRRSGRKTRRGGRGYWEGRTSQSIDGRLDMRLCPSPVRPWPRTGLGLDLFPYLLISRLISAPVSLRKGMWLCASPVVAQQESSGTWQLHVAHSMYLNTLVLYCSGYNKPSTSRMRLCFFSNCDMYQIKIRTHHGMSSIVRYAYVGFMRS